MARGRKFHVQQLTQMLIVCSIMALGGKVSSATLPVSSATLPAMLATETSSSPAPTDPVATVPSTGILFPWDIIPQTDDTGGEEETGAQCEDTCDFFSLFCAANAVCEMTEDCQAQCRFVEDGTTQRPLDDPGLTQAPVGDEEDGDDDGLRLLSERTCSDSGTVCIQGICPGGIDCVCDPGYKGSTCDTLECTLPCDHGYCSVNNVTGGASCVCDPGWGDTFCTKAECDLPCVHGSCIYGDGIDAAGGTPVATAVATGTDGANVTMFCTCEFDWIGQYCDEPKPEPAGPDNRVAMIVGISVPCGCVLLFLLAFYILWRHRVLCVFKVVNMFKAYEDDDDKIYDAYVSLAESDLGFVKDALYPRLEELGFKLYVHAKDGLGGEVKSEMILEAVEKSRRCIMILSGDYIRSEWCRFEYLIAQHETCVKLRQRIVPILLDDIGKEEKKKMDKSLRFIVDSVKCLRYPNPPPELGSVQSPGSPISYCDIEAAIQPGMPVSREVARYEKQKARFWERLKLSMPKKREAAPSVEDLKSPSLSCDSACPLSNHSHEKKRSKLGRKKSCGWCFSSSSREKKASSTTSMGLSKKTTNGRSLEPRSPVALISAKSLADPKLDAFYNDVIEKRFSNSNSDPAASKTMNVIDPDSLRLEITL